MFQSHFLSPDDTDQIYNTLVSEQPKDIVPCDFGYVLQFDIDDWDKINDFYRKIRIYGNDPNKQDLKRELLDYYEQFITRKYQDKTVCYEFISEPLKISYKCDRVVFAGLERLAELATNRSNQTFNHYAIGTGPTPVLPSDTKLDFEEARISMNENGFSESKGSSMAFAATFPTILPSMTVTESGIFDRAVDPSTMFLRTVYTGSNAVPHIFNQTFIATSHFVYMLSV